VFLSRDASGVQAGQMIVSNENLDGLFGPT